MNKAKIVIIITVLIDVIGFGIVVPILPYYVEEFGAGATTVTLLFSIFSLFSFLSGPFLGALSDRVGRRPVLIYSNIGMTIGWFVFASATSLPMLFLGRIINGMAAGNIVTAQSYFVDIARNEKERATNLGLIGVAFGVGFAVGPAIGGSLSVVSHSFPFWCAGVLAGINALIGLFILPESLKEKRIHPVEFNPLRPLYRATKEINLRTYYLIWMFFSCAIVINQSLFALFAQKVFNFTSVQTGVLFTINGVVVIINQAGLLKYVWLRYFTNRQLQIIMTASLVVGLAMFASASLPLFYASILFLGTGQAVLRVVTMSVVSGVAAPTEKGEKIGVLTAIFNANMVFVPVIAGQIFEFNPTFPYWLGAVLVAIACYFSIKSPELAQHNTPPKEGH
jgi:MFS family permease